MLNNKRFIFSGLTILLIIVGIASVCTGAVHISLQELASIIGHHMGLNGNQGFEPQQSAVLIGIRLPRVLLSMLIGGALAISGASLQGLFRNPLAEPGLIGISAGATLFASLMIVFGSPLLHRISSIYGYYLLSIAAFIGALVTTLIIYKASVYKGRTVIASLLLTGIAINSLAFAFTGLLTYTSTDDQLRSITFWSLGSLGGANWGSLLTVLPFIGIPLLGLPLMAKSLNALALGEAQAEHTGVPINRVKRSIIILSTMAVGASIAVSGMIGFIGLVIPHILRIAFTPNNSIVLFGSALLGASALAFSDLISRTIVAPAELPIGIVTALAGSPIFIYMIITQIKKQFI